VKPGQRAFGEDHLESRPGGFFVLTCPLSKGWSARTKKAQTVAEHPGTAVNWQEEIYEIIEALPLPEGGVRYTLAPWEARHAIRVIERYDGPTEAARAREHQDHRTRARKRRLSILLAPILGHLPGGVQERMESEFGAPARAMTLVSAMPLLVIGVISLLAFLAKAYGGMLLPAGADRGATEELFRGWPIVPFPLALYLFLESGARCAVAYGQVRPMGSLPGVLLYEIWAILRGRRRNERPPAQITVDPAAEHALEDRFRMLEALLALLTPEEQELLERRFGFDPLKWGRITLIVLLAIGGLNLLASVANFVGGAETFGDVLWLLAGGYLFLEQLSRRRRLAQGHPAGSILGALVRPLARGLLTP
jgi:hypothetical protein